MTYCIKYNNNLIFYNLQQFILLDKDSYQQELEKSFIKLVI